MSGVAVSRLSRVQARRLTDRIRTTGEALWSLLVEAHEGQAHLVLGYRSFKEYMAAEFGMSERMGFRVLDQGKVAKALTAAANEPVEVSQRQAAAIKPRLEEAVERIEAGDAPRDVVEELAKQAKSVSDDSNGAASEQGPLSESNAEDGLPSSSALAPASEDRSDGPPVAPTASDGEGGATRARGASLSVGSPNQAELLVEQVAGLTKSEWALISEASIELLRSALADELRRRKETRPPAMKAAEKPARPKTKFEKKPDCRHPINSRIGKFCGACQTTLP